MANFPIAFPWIMQFEDPKMEYAQNPDAPPGAFAISGINSAAFPNDFASIAAIPQEDRGPSVQAFYRKNFWNTFYDQLVSDEVAKRVLDMAVNSGAHTSVKLLQIAVDSLYASGTKPVLEEDGQWGPQTVAQTNTCSDSSLVPAFQQARVSHYRDIVVKNPSLVKYLNGWIARAQK